MQLQHSFALSDEIECVVKVKEILLACAVELSTKTPQYATLIGMLWANLPRLRNLMVHSLLIEAKLM